MNNNPIGIFDSGLGGLTILEQLKKALPNESFIYYADTLQAPYGDKSNAELIEINNHIINYFKSKNIKCIVFACNTSCAVVYPKLTLNIPCIELIAPAAKEAIRRTKNNIIAVLATSQTIKSHAYKNAIHKENVTTKVIEIPCPQLVPYVEKGEEGSLEAEKWAKQYINEAKRADVIIHGCSHYPYFESYWKGCMPNATFINPGVTVAKKLKETLIAQQIHRTKPDSELSFYISGPDNVMLKHIEKIPQGNLSAFIQNSCTINVYEEKSYFFRP